jgi:hypothetical protein
VKWGMEERNARDGGWITRAGGCGWGFGAPLFHLFGGDNAFGRAIRVLMRRRRSPMSDSRAPKGDELFGDLTSTLPDLCGFGFDCGLVSARFDKLWCVHC